MSAAAEHQRLIAAGVNDGAARVLAAGVTSRTAVRGDDERAYWRHLSAASPAARRAHAASEAVRINRRGSR